MPLFLMCKYSQLCREPHYAPHVGCFAVACGISVRLGFFACSNLHIYQECRYGIWTGVTNKLQIPGREKKLLVEKRPFGPQEQEKHGTGYLINSMKHIWEL